MHASTAPTLAGQDEVARIAALARAGGRLGIDTEFMSEGRYRALLCLVQVVADDPDGAGRRAHRAVRHARRARRRRRSPRCSPTPQIEIVLHAARQDVALLRRVWRTEVTNVFDTQVAAGFAGHGAQTGYGNLLGGVLRLHVAKTRELHALGRAPADRPSSSPMRARTCCTCWS